MESYTIESSEIEFLKKLSIIKKGVFKGQEIAEHDC